MSLVSCYHPTLTHSLGPPTRDPLVLTPTLVLSLRVPLCRRNQEGCLIPSLKTAPLLRSLGYRPNSPARWFSYDGLFGCCTDGDLSGHQKQSSRQLGTRRAVGSNGALLRKRALGSHRRLGGHYGLRPGWA